MKTRKMKRFATIAAIAMIASCMAVPMSTAFAADETATVTIATPTGGQADVVAHTYKAYQIFTGTYDATKGLTVSGWGVGVNSADLVADADFRTLLGLGDYDPDAVESAAAIAQKIDLITDDSANADLLATLLAKYKGTAADTFEAETEGGPLVAELAVGYYLVEDEGYTGTPNDAISKFMLKVEDGSGVTINTKKSYPTVVKKVKENKTIEGLTYNGDANYNDVADYNIGETIPFKLYADIPALTGYESYYIKLTDKLGEQFDLVSTAAEFVIAVDGTPVKANDYNIHIDTTDTSEITIEIEDIFALVDAEGNALVTTAGDVMITVAYNAELNNKAVVGRPGQINEVDLTYSNNPNEEYAPHVSGPSGDKDGDGNKDVVEKDTNGDGVLDEDEDLDGDGKFDTEADELDGDKFKEENETPESTDKTDVDKVIVFTYEVDTTKVDGADKSALEGATFKLANAAENGQYAVLTPVLKDGSEEVDYYIFNNEWSAAGTAVTTPADGIFKIRGLDEGNYWLEETDAPGTYNKLTSRVPVVLTANTLDEDVVDDKGDEDPENDTTFVVDRQDWNWATEAKQGEEALLDLTVTANGKAAAVDTNKGIGSFTIENRKGIQLPGTGGIGTTIFYVVGGTMAAGAGVYLISKKRMKKDEE